MFSKQNIVFFIGVMMLVSSLLMVVANNIPFLASYRWLWGPAIIIFSVFFNSRILQSKRVLYVFSFGVFFILILQNILWTYTNEWYRKMIFEDFLNLLIPMLLFQTLLSGNYIKYWIMLGKIGFFFIIVTGFMTVVATTINPTIVRASYSGGMHSLEGYDALARLGFGSYGYMTAILLLFPILVYLFKLKTTTKKIKILLLGLMLFLFYVLLRAQIFTNIMVGLGVLIVSFLGFKRVRVSLFMLVLALIVAFLIPRESYVSFLQSASEYFDVNSQNYYKLNDLADFVQNPEVNTTTGAGARAERYPDLIEAFAVRPLLGDASYDSKYDDEIAHGGHLYWMSHLALWGLLGFLLYVYILRKIFKSVLIIFNKEFHFYYLLSILTYIIMGLMKNLGGRELWIVFLIIIPGLYYSNLYSDKNTSPEQLAKYNEK